MNKRKTLITIEANFKSDLRSKLQPLYDIEQNVHEDTIKELKELFEAVGNFAFDEGVKFALNKKSKEGKNKWEKKNLI